MPGRVTLMRMKSHAYAARVVWNGHPRDSRFEYATYSRGYRTIIEGKPEIAGSADPMFRGMADRHNPEDLFVAAISACHMLTFLALCAWNGIHVVAYEDDAKGVMSLDGSGGGRFEEVTLHPRVTISDASRVADATKLHVKAHEQCFIANSCSVPIRNEPVTIAG
jgi:organic hydroperoxide reductase OsmC/OhrA